MVGRWTDQERPPSSLNTTYGLGTPSGTSVREDVLERPLVVGSYSTIVNGLGSGPPTSARPACPAGCHASVSGMEGVDQGRV